MRTLPAAALTLAALLTAATAFAQAPVERQSPDQPTTQQQPYAHHHGPNAQHETHMLTKKLGLTPDQASQIGLILVDRDQRVAALQTNTALTSQQMHQQRHAIMADTQGKLNSVLTDPQRQQLATMRAEHHHHEQQQLQQPTPNA